MPDLNAGKRAIRDNQKDPIENRLVLLVLIANLIPSALLLGALWYFQVSLYLLAIVFLVLLFLILYCATTVWRQTQFQFRSLHNLLDAVVRGDYTLRGGYSQSGSAFSELVGTINALARTLQRQRTRSEESQLLVQKVIDQIDVAIIAWDQEERIQFANPAACNLAGLAPGALPGDSSSQFTDVLASTRAMQVGETRVVNLQFGSRQGRYRAHLERFMADGNTHSLLFLTNVSSILRLEERRAWRNLVRVLSHEINNSLTPLKSFSEALKSQISKRERDEALKCELLEGMEVIANRANSLAHFVQSYQKIAKLPEPVKSTIEFGQLMSAIVKLFPEHRVRLQGEPISVSLDAAQIEQVMINLLKNDVEASTGADEIAVYWHTDSGQLVIEVCDKGTGILNSENLFTPYYTTKPAGSGVGLVFCQQVIEAHDGFLTIGNRSDDEGCEARFTLPLASSD
ncbi:MAG: ATP-binding protein [Gammaproteobacteria bacterium]|nr:PAS domain-containing protein [Pseudomonadales bacterium]MCP5346529.1 PAS domain-containing protein [Pseudomonadales bacterium]